LELTFYQPKPAKHAHVVLNRVKNPPPAREMRQPALTQPFWYWNCNMSLPGSAHALPGSAPFNSGVATPFPPQTWPAVPSPQPPQTDPRARTLTHCYRVNDLNGVQIAWTLHTATSMLDIHISYNTTASKGQYIALGFGPEMPFMLNADIALGYITSSGQTCARAMTAADQFGTPVDYAGFVISKTSVTYQNGRLALEFSRSLDTGKKQIYHYEAPWGHFPWRSPARIMWAFGAAPENCTANPSYHLNNRGLRGWNWHTPSFTTPDHMKC